MAKVYQVTVSTGSEEGFLYSNLKKAYARYCLDNRKGKTSSYSKVASHIKATGTFQDPYKTMMGNDAFQQIKQRTIW